MAPQTHGGWDSSAIGFGVATGDLHRAKVTVFGAQAQEEDKHFLRRWSKGLRCLYHHEMGGLNYCRSSPGIMWLWQVPPNPLGEEWLGRKPELVTPWSTAQHKPIPALLAMLL